MSKYGKSTRVTDVGGGRKVMLECKNIAPGLTVHDLVQVFEAASKGDGVSRLSGNPSNWPTVRGVTAVANVVVKAFEKK